jgi:hypothetical protein
MQPYDVTHFFLNSLPKWLFRLLWQKFWQSVVNLTRMQTFCTINSWTLKNIRVNHVKVRSSCKACFFFYHIKISLYAVKIPSSYLVQPFSSLNIHTTFTCRNTVRAQYHHCNWPQLPVTSHQVSHIIWAHSPHCLLEIVQGLCNTSAAATMKIRGWSMHKFSKDENFWMHTNTGKQFTRKWICFKQQVQF